MKKKISILLMLALLFLPIVTYAVSEEDDEIEVKVIDAAKVGNKPTYATSNKYFDVVEQEWINDTDHKPIGTFETFKRNTIYYYYLVFKVKEEYLEKDFNLTANLEDSDGYVGGYVFLLDGDDTFVMIASYYIGNQEDLNNVDSESFYLDIDSPKLGGTPTYARKNSKYTINSEKWMNLTDNKEMKSTDKFEENKKYQYIVDVTSYYDEGDFFENFNDNEYYLGEIDEDSVKLTRYIRKANFYFGDAEDLVISGATAKIENKHRLVPGEKLTLPEVTTTPELETYAVWQKYDEFGKLETAKIGETIEAGATYFYILGVYGEVGYRIDDDFKFIDEYSDNNLVEKNEYLGSNNATFYAIYKVLETGKTFGIDNQTHSIAFPGDSLSLQIYPESKRNEEYSWATSDSSIVSIAGDGWVSANKSGTATITITNSKGEKATIDIVVGVPVESITLNKTKLELKVGDTYQLVATVYPSNATRKEISWGEYVGEDGKMQDAITYRDGYVVAKKPGKATIYAHTPDGPEVICEVTVIDNSNMKFNDVNKNDWYYESVKYAYDNKIIMGYTDTKFAPNDKVTRGQLVTILWRLEGTPDASTITNKFSDVPSNDYFTSAVKWAEKNEIIHGYNAQKFGPNDPITRQDLAVILNNFAKYKELNASWGEDISSFEDYSKVKGSYSEPALRWAVRNKVMSGQNINGKKYLAPTNNATRAETAAMVTNFIQKFNLK